jgi:hypothetical protein
MRRSKAFTHGRGFAVLVVGTIGYLIGGWHPAALRTQNNLSAAESVALRFPQEWDTVAPVAVAANPPPAAAILNASATAANSADDAQFALLSPEPMVPQAVHQAVSQAPQDPVLEATVQMAAAEDLNSLPALNANKTRQAPPPAAVAAAPVRANRAPAVAGRRLATNRPGYMLDDAQIASIKERLHLTPDQEQMWPAVEAALRNIAYTRARQERGRGVPAGSAQLAADVDPESVVGLKSAAVPLIMSFNDEQKQEVRDLAHVMGLDQLASQF